MWKHRDALFRPRYGALGFVAMPNVWIFQILFPLISPVMDLMLIYMLISSALDRWQQPAGLFIDQPTTGAFVLRAVSGD